MNDREIKEAYMEDTDGRKYHPSIVTKGGGFKTEKAKDLLTTNLHKPMTKNEFGKLPNDLKVAYIKGLREKYCPTVKEVANMLGYNPCHLSVLCGNLGLKGLFTKAKQTKEQQKAWKEFCQGDKPIENTTINNTVIVNEAPKEKKVETTEKAPVFEMSFTQNGVLNTEEIARRINALIADGTKCEVTITIKRG